MSVSTLKRCSVCTEDKPQESFYAKGGKCKRCQIEYSKRYKEQHRDKYAAYLRDWRQRNRDHYRAYLHAYKLRQYGLTPEEYEALLEKQDGHCAICLAPPETNKRLAVDHDHETGAVRGLLCFRCNTSIETLTVPGVLHRAVEYLRRAEG